MIYFMVEASYNYKNSQNIQHFSATDYQDVIDKIKNYWNQFGLKFNRDEGLLSAKIFIENQPIIFYIGDFVFDEKMDLTGMSPLSEHGDNYREWHAIGLAWDENDDPEWLFARKIQFLFEKNTPEKLLGSWLIKLSLESIDFKDIAPEQAIIAHLLKFSDQQDKLFEMYQWCISTEGEKFFNSNYNFCNAAGYVCDELREITDGNFKNLSMNADEENNGDLDESENLEVATDNAPMTKEKIIVNLRHYIKLYDRPLPVELWLQE
jgi:hypothetical protein